MDWSGGESREQQAQPQALPPFPRIWIGYLLGVATLIAEMIAVTLHPELAKEPLIIPPLYLFLANFISLAIGLFVFMSIMSSSRKRQPVHILSSHCVRRGFI